MAFARLNGIDLYYEAHGEGRALVLSHGIGSNHLHWWQQVPAFSKRFQVITFDHRAFGFSKDTNGLGPKAFVDDLDALLSHLRVDKAILCGQSMGGITVGGFASRHPDRASALILSCSGGGFYPVAPSEAFVRGMAQVRNYQDFARLSIEQDGFPQRHPELRFLFESMAQLNYHVDMSKAADLRTLHFELGPIVDRRVPTLLIGAEEDNGANAALKRIHDSVAGSKLSLIPGSGHLAFFESAEAYNRTVLDFLSNL